MGRLFKEVYKVKGGTRRSKKWYGLYRGLDGREHKVALSGDRRTSERALLSLEDALENAGANILVDRASVHHLVWDAFVARLRDVSHPLLTRLAGHLPVDDQLDEWADILRGRGVGGKYLEQRKKYAKQILSSRFLSEVSLAKSSRVVSGLREKALSTATIQAYIGAARQFIRWTIEEGRLTSDPLSGLRMIRGTPLVKRRRRALSEEEAEALLAITKSQRRRAGLPGPARSTLYLLAMETGLRANELRNLTLHDLHLDADPPSIVVRAAYSKNRKEDVIPVRAHVAEALRGLLREQVSPFTGPLFPLPGGQMLRAAIYADLRAAGIEPIQPEGRVDFHALRHTFITRLARAGVHPRVAQDLARHSKITLTMQHYTHTVIEDRLSALERLPSPAPAPAKQESA